MSRRTVLTRLPADALIFVIELYRTYVSPTRMPVCRFTPTCSEYAVTALRTRGLFVGLGLAAVRLVKCAPWHPGGWDPVPEPKRKGAAADPTPPASLADESHSSPGEAGHENSEPAAQQTCKGSPPAVTGDTTDGSA
ncbi:membrane protein insertion efficiency factor YidD [Nocardia blacklockiae]|uniref:membrane protein insertion efficiency factor YidD n=1 Tax=Nocardia blacklockiae TaxID=480036 RepID=UPI001895A83A|nr:membrane protein insertion efficiency factor YidD [Nocardia blacklockiae]MBF6176074.1 membrane protein insertion efficiency factor YidD [Nocardia blacklockiae]